MASLIRRLKLVFARRTNFLLDMKNFKILALLFSLILANLFSFNAFANDAETEEENPTYIESEVEYDFEEEEEEE